MPLKKALLITLIVVAMFTLSACANAPSGSNNHSQTICAANFAFCGVAVGDSVADMLRLLGEPDWVDEVADSPTIESIYRYSGAYFIVAEQLVIAYYVYDAIAGFRPFGISIGDTWEEAVASIEEADIPLTRMYMVGGVSTDNIYPNTAHLIIETAEEFQDSVGVMAIFITTDTMSPALDISFANGIVDSLQVSVSN